MARDNDFIHHMKTQTMPLARRDKAAAVLDEHSAVSDQGAPVRGQKLEFGQAMTCFDKAESHFGDTEQAFQILRVFSKPITRNRRA